MIIPEATIQRIKDEADIVKIIGEYIKLEKKGGNFMGVCPFHPDSNPSLTVSPTKKIYKCFSCGASGNAITFVQEFEHVPFVKAVQVVGEKCGIKVEVDSSFESSQNLEKYYKLMQEATKFYEFFLKNTSDGQEALNYLYKRKLNDEIIKRFKIGLAPKEADLLYKSLVNDKFQPLDMIEAGVVRSNNNYYDVFRNRIMFPIDDIDGHIVGFSGRIYQTKKTEESKYLNSSENIIFKKGNILYNFHEAINDIRIKDQVFVFEGFMDVIAAYRAKVNNAIATMGTSLTPNQIRAIGKVTKNVVICYDGDNPGIEATKKAIQLFTDAKFNVKTILMPEGLDPDEYINKYGEEKLNDFLNNKSLNGIDYLYEVEKRNLIVADISSVEKFKNAIFKYMHFYHSNVLNERYLKRLSEDINVSVESLQSDFSKTLPTKEIIEQTISDIIDIGIVEKKPKKHKKMKYENAEKYLIRQIYYHRKKCLEAKNMLDLKYVNKANRDILYKLYEYYQNNEEMNDDLFQNNLNPEQIALLVDILNDKNSFNDFIEINDLVDCIITFQLEKEEEKLIEKYNGNYTEEFFNELREIKKKKTKFKE